MSRHSWECANCGEEIARAQVPTKEHLEAGIAALRSEANSISWPSFHDHAKALPLRVAAEFLQREIDSGRVK